MYKQVEPGSRIIGLSRRSTDEKRQADSPDAQRRAIEDVCELHDLQLDLKFGKDGIYHRDGSGLTLDREDIDAAIEHCQKNGIDQVLFAELSRFSREDTQDAAARFEQFQTAGVRIVFCNRMPRLYDLDDYQDRTEIFKELEFAHMYSRMQAETVISRKRARAERMLIPPYPSFGFQVLRTKKDVNKDIWWIVPDSEKLDIIRKAGEMFVAGESTEKIVALFRDSGFLTDKKKEWTWVTIRRILVNPIYCGDYVHFKWKSGRIKSAGAGYAAEDYTGTKQKGVRYVMKMEEQPEENQTIKLLEDQKQETCRVKWEVNGWIPDPDGEEVLKNTTSPCQVFTRIQHQSIVDRVQAKHIGKRSRPTRKKHLLTGFGKCSNCGGPLCGHLTKKTKVPHTYYFCTHERFKKACSGGSKTIRESDLLKHIMHQYYFTVWQHPEIVLEQVREHLKEIQFGDEYRDITDKIAGLETHLQNLAERNKIGTTQYSRTEERIFELEKRRETMPVTDASSIPRYDGDEMSLTSAITSEVLRGDANRIKKKAGQFLHILDWDASELSRDLISDVLDSFRVDWIINDGPNQVGKIHVKYRLGFTSTEFWSNEALPADIRDAFAASR
jgi:hypothetical protein